MDTHAHGRLLVAQAGEGVYARGANGGDARRNGGSEREQQGCATEGNGVKGAHAENERLEEARNESCS